MTDKQLDQLGRVLRLLTDPTRLRIIWLLQAHGEATVTDICGSLKTEQSRTSHKLGKMARLNLVKARRDGQWVYYSLVDPLAIRAELIGRLNQVSLSAMSSSRGNEVASSAVR